MPKNWTSALLLPDVPLRAAMEQMNRSGIAIVLVVDADRKLLGTLTDGDIRRSIAAGADLAVPIGTIMYTQPTVISPHTSAAQIVNTVRARALRYVPVVDADHCVTDLLDWSQAHAMPRPPATPQSRPVVIMAGGQGLRLRPLTSVLPKPLIPISGKPLIEHVMGRFAEAGFNHFILTVNYLGDTIRQYFQEASLPYQIDIVTEPAATGTAGSLHLVRPFVTDGCYVSNCDVLLEADLAAVQQYHVREGNAATIVAVEQQHRIPYGVLETSQNRVTAMREKPQFDFVVNSGVYLLEKSILDLVTSTDYLDMPTLLQRAIDGGQRVGTFRVSQDAWFDVGQWDQFREASQWLERGAK